MKYSGEVRFFSNIYSDKDGLKRDLSTVFIYGFKTASTVRLRAIETDSRANIALRVPRKRSFTRENRRKNVSPQTRSTENKSFVPYYTRAIIVVILHVIEIGALLLVYFIYPFFLISSSKNPFRRDTAARLFCTFFPLSSVPCIIIYQSYITVYI